MICEEDDAWKIDGVRWVLVVHGLCVGFVFLDGNGRGEERDGKNRESEAYVWERREKRESGKSERERGGTDGSVGWIGLGVDQRKGRVEMKRVFWYIYN